MQKAAKEPLSKSGIVKTLLARGLKGPKEISDTAKSEFGADITPGYVSTIKTGMKSRKGKAVVRRARVVTPGTVSAPQVEVAPLENMALRFALKAGGIDKAIAALEKLR